VCQDKRRNEIDKRLLDMDLSKESYRRISSHFGIHEASLRRHKKNCLTVDLAGVKQAIEQARVEALAEVHDKKLEEAKANAAESMAGRLEAATNYFDQLKELRDEAASLLDACEDAKDLKSCIGLLRELREQIRLSGELEGKIKLNVAMSIYNSPQWREVGIALAEILAPHPELKRLVADRLLILAKGKQ